MIYENFLNKEDIIVMTYEDRIRYWLKKLKALMRISSSKLLMINGSNIEWVRLNEYERPEAIRYIIKNFKTEFLM